VLNPKAVPEEPAGDARRRGRRLGPLLCWAVVFADIGTSVYYTPGILFGQVGTHAALFVAMTLAVFLLLTIKYAEVAIRYPEGGGVVTVASRAIHPFAGLLGGLLILVDYFLTASLSALSGVIYFTLIAGSLKPHVLVATVAALVLLGLLNLIGVRTSAQVTAIIAVVALLGQLAVVVAVAVHLGPAGIAASIPKALAGPGLGPLSLLTGYAGAFLAFSGLESIAQLAPAMAEPRKRVAPRAMGLVVLTIAVTSPLITLWSTTLLDAKGTDPNQFVSLLAGYAAGPILQISVASSASLLLVFASNTALIGTYNVFLALARMRFLPQFLTATNPWRGTPHFAILVATAVPVSVVVFSNGNVGLLGDLYAFGLLGAFSVTCIALDLVRFHEQGSRLPAGSHAIQVGRVNFLAGLLTTLLVSAAWITNLFAKPLATLFGGGVTILGLGIALLTYRLAGRKEPVVFPRLHRHQQPVVLMSGGRRLPPARLLVVLPHDAEQAEGLVELVAAEAPGERVDFLYIGHEDTARRETPSPFEILDPYARDKRGQQVFGRAARANRKLSIDARYIYVPARAEPGTLDWLVNNLASEQVMMFDDGAGLSGADRATLERHASGTDTILHYRLRDAPGTG
jgi:amino acid transporter